MTPIRVLGLVGSLRVGSHNRTLLEAVGELLPSGVNYVIYPGLDFPLFAPDRAAPASVLRFRQALDDADGVLIASPEYAHGVTGVIKNALDWVVTSNQFSGKPVACLNASPASHHAWHSLLETLKTMDARVVEAASIQATLEGPSSLKGPRLWWTTRWPVLDCGTRWRCSVARSVRLVRLRYASLRRREEGCEF